MSIKPIGISAKRPRMGDRFEISFFDKNNVDEIRMTFPCFFE